MRRIHSHLAPIAALAAVCLIGQTVIVDSAWGAPASTKSTVTPQVKKEIQEALAKAEAEKRTGGSGASTSSSGSSVSSKAFSNLTSTGATEGTKTATTKTTPTSTSAASSGSTSTGTIVFVMIIAGLLLGAIAVFIVRDARSVAPAGDMLGSGSQDRAVQMRKRRAKAKAARRQRKRNR